MEEFIELYKCPLTQLLFCDPVLAEDGVIYEKMAIESWLKDNDISPTTKETIGNTLISIHQYKYVVSKILEKYPEKVNETFMCVYPYSLFKEQFMDKMLNGHFSELPSYRNICITDLLHDECTTIAEYLFRSCKDNEIVKGVIDNSLDFDCADFAGHLPLHIACRFSNTDIVNYLLDKGATVNSVNLVENLPIHYYLKHNKGNTETVLRLINGCENEGNKDGLEPIHILCSNAERHDNPQSILETLKEFGASLYSKSVEGLYPIHYGCLYSSDVDFIKSLLEGETFELETDSNKSCDELIYMNPVLSIDEKRELVFLFIKRLHSKVVLIDDYMEEC